MRLNHATARRELKAQRWGVTQTVEALRDLESHPVDVHRTVMSSYLSGNRPCTDVAVILGLAELLNLNPYVLIGPEDAKGAAVELCHALGVTAGDLEALEQPRHAEAVPA